MTRRLIFLAVFLGLVHPPASALARVEELTIYNDTNGDLICAFTRRDPETSVWVTRSWSSIPRNRRATFANVDYYRCEQQGDPTISWGTTRSFCVTRGAHHRSPLPKADSRSHCREVNGEWRTFGELPHQATYTLYLNPLYY